MSVVEIEGFSVAADLLHKHSPVLDAAPGDHRFVHGMAKLGHFTFQLESNPSYQPTYVMGMSFIRKAIVPRPVIGNVVYAVKHGNAEVINPRRAETYVDCHIEYVQAFDLTMISRDLGIQQWGLIKLNHDANDILSELPGPMAQQLIAIDALTDETKRHLNQWYEKYTDTLWVIKTR